LENTYELIIAGHLDDRSKTWFEGMAVALSADGNTKICGTIKDKAQLHGIISRVRDLGLELISLQKKEMDRMDKKSSEEYRLTGPCGTYCGDCECYKAKDNPKLLEYLVTKGLRADRLPCPGCRPLDGNCPAVGGVCETYTCVQEHGVEFCYECAEFPCARLNPAADRANVLPHNMKLFNLCCIQRHGLERFVQEFPDIRKKYFQGRMMIGKGPQLE